MFNIINKIMWAIATSFILIVSIFFTFKLQFVQLDIKEMFACLKKKGNHGGLKPFEVLMMTLGGRIGVGSIAGVALGIYLGGPGSIFWMWIISILSSVLAYSETVLGIMYKEVDEKEISKGGPSFYIKNGLGYKKLGGLYAILIIASYIGCFLGIQSNTIVKSMTSISAVNPFMITFIIVFFTSMIIFGGVRNIANAMCKIVPVMAILYLAISGYIIIKNIGIVPAIFLNIISSAFQFKSLFSGFLLSFIVGIQRGIFSSEAGMGTGSISASITNIDEPSSQGYIQILSVYITNLLICSATAFIILLSNYDMASFDHINGIEIVSYAFRYHFGVLADIILFIFIFLFSFSTILTGYYYGESSLKYFYQNINKGFLLILKIFTLIIIFLGGIISSTLLWSLVDIFAALLVIINLYAIFSLKNEIIGQYKYYKSKKCVKI